VSTTVEIKPNAQVSISSATVVGGGGVSSTALSDSSDASYVQQTTGTVFACRQDFGTYTIGANEKIEAIRAKFRLTNTGAAHLNRIYSRIYREGLAGTYASGSSTITQGVISVPTWVVGSQWYFNKSDAGVATEWTQSLVDQVEAEVYNQLAISGTQARIMELWLELRVLQIPVVAWPGGMPSYRDTTSQFSWTYTGNGETQKKYRLKIYTAAQVAGGGFDPETTVSPHFDSGHVLSSVASGTATGLTRATDYVAFVKVAKAVGDDDYWSNGWAQSAQFKTLDAPIPTAMLPTSANLTTNVPAVTWTISTAAGDPGVLQTKYRVKVYRMPGGGWGGFDPINNTVDLHSDSQEVVSAIGSYQVTVPLNNAQQYRAYVKLWRNNPDGANYIEGAYTATTFTTDFSAPGAPTIVTALDPTGVDVDITVTPGAKNMLTVNQSTLEVDTAGWSSGAAGSETAISRSTLIADHGVASLRVQKTIGTGPGEAQIAFAAAKAAIVGTTYTGFARSALQAGTNRNTKVGLRWYTAGGATISTSFGTAIASGGVGVWGDRSVTAVAPATTAFVGLVVVAENQLVTTEFFHWDKMMVAASPVVTAWIKGDTPDEVHYVIERQAGAGAAWETFHIGSGITSALYVPPGEPFTVTDYQPREGLLVNSYRAYGVGLPLAGTYAASAASNVDTEVLSKQQVWVKDLWDPTKNKHFYVTDDWMVRTKKKSRALNRPIGRSKPIVVKGQGKDNAFSINFLIITEAEMTALDLLIDSATLLYLQTPKGNWRVEVAGDYTISERVWDAVTAEQDAYQVTVPFQEVN
jgi:hypothetical protein